MSRSDDASGTWSTVEAKEWKVQEANDAGEGECESGGVAVVDVDGVENVSEAWETDNIGACLSSRREESQTMESRWLRLH